MRIFDILYQQKEKYPLTDCIASKVNGIWNKISTEQFIATAETLAYGFLDAGITKGDKIASVCSNNRIEWNYVDMATLMTGAIHLPIYPTISDDDYKFIFNDAEVKYLFVSDAKLYARLKEIARQIPTIKNVYTFDDVPDAPHWKELYAIGEKNPCPERLTSIKKSINPGDLATLIYTSGTTGTPKGVMLSHNNIVSNVLAARVFVPVEAHGKALSFLPLCHVYERMLNYLYQYLGISIYYAESIDAIGDNLKEVKPDIFVAVPRVLEKVYDRVLAAGNALPDGIKKKLFFWALNLGVRYEMNGANGWWYEFQLSIARALVFKKWQAGVGGNVKVIASGSAPLQPRLQRVFWAAGIPVLEGYGLTETSPVISVNTLQPGCARFGTVGPVIPGVEVKIADDGEILCKGLNVMMGYYKRPDLTMEAIDSNGWFHTGDIGVFKDKFLMITDRKKELLKTSGGKYVAPQPIENKMKESPYISQIMVVGDGRKFTGALIVPNFHNLNEWCKTNNVPITEHRMLIQNDKVHALYEAERDRLNAGFGHVEQIKRFELLPDEWTQEGGELTPTLKLKRKFILEKYRFSIEKIYAE